MWDPISIEFTNLFSHQHTIFDFKKNEMILLLGRNQDKAGADSNGAGKSAIIESVCLSVTGDVYRSVNKSSFIRRDQKDCTVKFKLYHSVTKEEFRIERQFFNGSKSTVTKVFENNKQNDDLTNPNETNKYILAKLGVSKDDFLNYYVIGQGNNNSFFGGGDTLQKQVIARFSNYQQIDQVLDKLKNEVDELNEDLKPYNNNLKACEAVIDHIQQQIDDESERFEAERMEKLEDKTVEIDEVKVDIEKYQVKIKDQEAKIKTSHEALSKIKLKVKNIDKLKELLIQNKQLLSTKEQELKEINSTVRDLNNQDGAALNCPKCGEAFIPDSDLSPAEVKEMLELTKELKQSTIEEQEVIEVDIETIKGQINEQSEIASQIRIKTNEIESFEDIKLNYQNQIESKTKRLKNLVIEFQAIKSSKPEKSILELKSKLQIQKSEKQNIEIKIQDFENQIAEKTFYQYHFGKAGLKTFLANKSIKAVQDVSNYYLETLETNLQVVMSGYKLLKSGEVRDQIETKVITDGIEQSLFNAYSGGERCRIDACGAIAINFMINNNSETGGLNLIIFDERADLDATGQELIIKMLSKLEMTCVLVLHHVNNLPYKNKVYVEKQNKISRLIQYTEPIIDATKLLQLSNAIIN